MKIFLLLLFFNVIYGYKVLYLLPSASKSHKYVYDPLILELAKRGHQVTVISPYPFPKPIENVNEITTEKPAAGDASQLSKILFQYAGSHIIPTFWSFQFFLSDSCEIYLKNSQVKDLLKKGKQFDVVLVSQVFNDCAFATAPLLAKHVLYHSSSSLIPWLPTDVPQPPSYIPYSLNPYGSKMNFFQRLDNFVSWYVTRLMMDYYFVPTMQSMIGEHLKENPSIMEARKHVAFTLTNADPVITSPRPSLPNVVNVGGMHCKKAKPVSKEFEDFIQSSGENGFILFSLGTNIQSKDIPNETKMGIVKALSRLKQNVIWKYEEELENMPKNVKVTKWLPQQDILGHPKIRLFITHGGMLSLQESVYNGVPLVAIPLFAEQPGNVARVEEIGIGVKLELHNISEVSMYEAISKVLNDKSYAENMKRHSAVFHDFIENQVEKAIYWLDYVIRHDGAPHLRSYGAELNFFQYFLLDVICFLLAILGVVLFIFVKLGKIVVHKFCGCKKLAKEKSEDKKKQ